MPAFLIWDFIVQYHTQFNFMYLNYLNINIMLSSNEMFYLALCSQGII